MWLESFCCIFSERSEAEGRGVGLGSKVRVKKVRQNFLGHLRTTSTSIKTRHSQAALDHIVRSILSNMIIDSAFESCDQVLWVCKDFEVY